MARLRLRVGLDVDDVLYGCNEYALTLLRDKYGDSPEFDVNRITSWGPQGNRGDERIPMFSDPGFVSAQPVLPGAKRFVRELSRIAEVFFITAVPPACMSARASRLIADFPEVPPENIIIGKRKDLIIPDMLLDDAAHNILASKAAYPVLMRRPWNTQLSGLLSVNAYPDFLHLVRMVRNSFVEKAPDLSSGGVICLVGPSGTGKAQIASALCKDPLFERPLTTTTRPINPGECETTYRFVDRDCFLAEKAAGHFIETTVYSGHFFGTSYEAISPITDAGRIAVIPIDVCGALALKNLYKNRALLVYTGRDREGIIRDILQRPITDDDKTHRILSLDFEIRNRELCELAVDYEVGVDRCAEAIRNRAKRG